MTVNWNEIEAKWRKKWAESRDFETNPNENQKIHYSGIPISEFSTAYRTWKDIHAS